MKSSSRRVSLLALVLAMLALAALAATATAASSHYVLRTLAAQEVDHHPVTRLWFANSMWSFNGQQKVRVWNYRPGVGYISDSGQQYGYWQSAGTQPYSGTIWCQNWGTAAQASQCTGVY